MLQGRYQQLTLYRIYFLITSKKQESPEDLILVIRELIYRQLDIKRVRVEKGSLCLLSLLKFSRGRILDQKQQEKFLGTRVLAEKESLNIKWRDIFVDVKIGLDTRVYKSQSQLIRLVRILLVLCSKMYQCLFTFLQIVLEESQNFVSVDQIYKIVTRDKYQSRSKKQRRRLRYKNR